MAKKEEENKENVLKKILGQLLKRKKLTLVIIVIVVAFFGYRYYANRNGDGLEIAEVKKGTVKEELILSGEIAADEHAELTFSTSG